MTQKKLKISSKSLNIINNIGSKPSTITRAAITADIKLTRGKQLVEHNPRLLIPDPNNPRPGEIIDDQWLISNLKIGTNENLCRLDEVTGQFLIPKYEEIPHVSGNIKEDYEFLRSLAYSIRVDGLIEPIEIFLADKNNDPEYFINTELNYGYVILEGHQRRLAAIMAGIPTVTCIELTDETTLARLKVKQRKLRRQLSENNLRKNLTVNQNYQILRELLKTEDCAQLSVKELSSIVGLNEDITGALKRLCLNQSESSHEIAKVVSENLVSYKWIRTWIGKKRDEIFNEINRLTLNIPVSAKSEPVLKPRGKNGGAVKRTAIFKVSGEVDSQLLQDYLLMKIPELKNFLLEGSPLNTLENILNQLLYLAKSTSRPGSLMD